MKDLIKGGIITLIIGGSVFTFSQTDVIKNFAEDTGLTQEQAEQYINEINEDEFITFDEMGTSLIDEGKGLLSIASEINCIDYEYEWESSSLTCQAGKEQINKIGNDYILLGGAYLKLSTDSASKIDMSKAIQYIDELNTDYEFEIISVILEPKTIDENQKSNSFNKAMLKSALESK